MSSETMAARRELVAQLRLRGLTIREIAAQVGLKFINPQTEQPYTYQTIHDDLKAMEAEWREEAAATIAQHKAIALAEIKQVKRAAWSSNDYRVILQALRQEAQLLGLDMPTKIAPTDPSGEKPFELTVDARDALAQKLADIAERESEAADYLEPDAE